MKKRNVQSIHDLIHDIETTSDAILERNALLNLFDYIRQLEEMCNSYQIDQYQKCNTK